MVAYRVSIDWLINNTNWEDWKEHAELIDDTVSNMDDDWWTNYHNFIVKGNN